MKFYLSFLFSNAVFLFYTSSFLGQAQVIKCLHSGAVSGDSSYYDIFKVSSNQFWVGGKYGILKSLNQDESLADVQYPNQGVSILRINRMNSNRILIAADKGILYINENNKWVINYLEKYNKSCFYDLCVVDSLTAFICGGKSKIAVGKRSIPFGFILMTEDGGNTWKRVYSSWKRMIWRLEYDKENNALYSLTYSPFGSRVLCSQNSGKNWKKTKIKSNKLWYDLDLSDQNCLVTSGGRTGNLKGKEGYVTHNLLNSNSNTAQSSIFNSGLIWDYTQNKDVEVAGGSNGNLMVRSKSEKEIWAQISAPYNVNLYEICFISDSSAFIIGSNKNIFRLDIKNKTRLEKGL